MLKNRFIFSALAIIIVAATVFSGCASSSNTSAEKYYSAASSVAPMAPSAAPQEAADEKYDSIRGESGLVSPQTAVGSIQQPQSGRKLIWTAEISISSKEFDTDINAITKIIEDAGGWIENSSISGLPFSEADGRGRNSSITARIPVEKFNDSMTRLSSVGVTQRVSSSSEDISLRYSDVELRKKSVETQLDRMLELLEKADVMEDIIRIEQEISRLTYELESLTRQLINWDNSVDYATIHISLSEEKSYNVTYSASFGEKLVNSFNSGLEAFRVFWEGVALVIAALLPFIILAAIVVVIIIALFGIRRKGRASKDKAPKGPYTAPGSFGKIAPSDGSEPDKKTDGK